MSKDNDDGFVVVVVVALYRDKRNARARPPRVCHDKSTRNIPTLINRVVEQYANF